MAQYYYLTSSLPPLRIGDPPEMDFEEFVFALQVSLKKEQDKRPPRVMRRYYDLQNLRRLWTKRGVDEKLGEELDARGNLDENELEEALLTQQGLPEYVYDFTDQHERSAERLKHFPQLISWYFQEEQQAAECGFLYNYLVFEQEWRLVLTGFRAKQLGRDLTQELQYEDPYNEVVRQLLAQKDAEYYEPPTRYKDLKELFAAHKEDALGLHKALCHYRFDTIEEMVGVAVFGLEKVLGYMAQLILVEKWMELDKQKGLEVVDKITKEAS